MLVSRSIYVVFVVLISIWFSMNFGASDQVSWFSQDSHSQRVLWELRLPRTLVAFLAGAQFAVSGYLLQRITKNPLADPGLLGISAGASLAVVSLFLLGDIFLTNPDPYRRTPLPLIYLPLVALLGGLLATAIVWKIWTTAKLDAIRLTLVGVAVAAIFSAAVTGVLAVWGGSYGELIVEWMAGSLYGRSWLHFHALWPWSLVLFSICLFIHRTLSQLQLPPEPAAASGVDVPFWVSRLLALAALLAATAVAVVGPVAFVGLIVPHISKILIPSFHRLSLWVTALLGGWLMVVADLIGRMLFVPMEMPIGIVTSILGVPYFLYLLRKQNLSS